MKVSAEIERIANETEKLDKNMSENLKKIARHVSSTMPDLEISEDIKKEAKLINNDDIVVCVDNFAPLFKGRKYRVFDNSLPGYLMVKELDGSDVGVFEINRFVLDNNEQ
jgi:hypothetical protein